MTRTLLSLFLCALLAGCSDAHAVASAPTSPQDTRVVVQVMTARIEELPNALSLDGTLEPKRRARLSPLVSGHVAAVRVERGDVVGEGDPLIVLRSAELRLAASAASARARSQLDQLGVERATDFDPDVVPEVVAARADFSTREDHLRRVTPLHASGVVDDRAFEQARMDTDAARARFEQARARARGSLSSYVALASEAGLRRSDASNATVRAPFAGAVVERLVEVGEFVSTQSPVVELVDATELRLELDVPERFAQLVHEGQAVTIRVDGTDQTLAGVVRHVAASLDTVSRTLPIEVAADNSDGTVRAGHFARAELALDGVRAVVRVPSSAIAERAGVFRLFVVEGGVASTRIVRVVSREDEVTTIESDIPHGALVVTRPPRNLVDGVRVRVRASH